MQIGQSCSVLHGAENGVCWLLMCARCRNLRKKLAKVETAKEKQSKGEPLAPEQQESIAGEAALRMEMRSLGATDV